MTEGFNTVSLQKYDTAIIAIVQFTLLESVMEYGRQCQFEYHTTDSASLALAPFWNTTHGMQKTGKLMLPKKNNIKNLMKAPVQ